MKNEIFEKLLLEAKINKKTFSELVGLNYNSVINWNKSDKIPSWVESWLTLYIENNSCRKLKEILQTSGICK